MIKCEYCGRENLQWMPIQFSKGDPMEFHRRKPMTKFDEKMMREYGGFTPAGWMCPKLKEEKSEPKMVFITIQDFQRRMCDLEKLQQFIKSIAYMYSKGNWIIETGKQQEQENFNIHIHLFVCIRPTCKNHKKVLNTKWMKYFSTSMYESDYYLIKQHRDVKGMPTYNDWCQEKLDYFDNALKGSHANTIDLELTGTF